MNISEGMRRGAVAAIYGDLALRNERLRRAAKMFYGYTLNWLPLAASTTETKTFLVDRDSEFWLTGFNMQATAVATPITPLAGIPVLLSVRSNASGRDMQSAAFKADMLAGTGPLPGILAYPWQMPGGSVISVTAQNLTATAYDVYSFWQGIKVFDYEDPYADAGNQDVAAFAAAIARAAADLVQAGR